MSAFAQVGTQPKADKTVLNPRATRYGMLPIWPLQTAARDFYVWQIPANTVFPFRPFIGEIGRDMNDRILYTHERMPEDQILDMYAASPFFVELAPLAEVSEDNVKRIAEVLANPEQCEKYPFELNTACVSCWLKDSLTSMDSRISVALADSAELQRVARKCMEILRDGLNKAIGEARRQLDVAIRAIDDPKSGKTMFYDTDYLNVYHTHSERPQYRTSTSGTDSAAQIAQAISDMVKKQDAPAPAVDIEAIVAAAVSKATEDLRTELSKYKLDEKGKKAETIEDGNQSIKDKVAAAKEKVKTDEA